MLKAQGVMPTAQVLAEASHVRAIVQGCVADFPAPNKGDYLEAADLAATAAQRSLRGNVVHFALGCGSLLVVQSCKSKCMTSVTSEDAELERTCFADVPVPAAL